MAVVGRAGLPAGAGARVGPATADLGPRRAADPAVRLLRGDHVRPGLQSVPLFPVLGAPVKSPHRPEMVLVLSFLAILAAPAIVQTVDRMAPGRIGAGPDRVSPAPHRGQPARVRAGTGGRQLGGATAAAVDSIRPVRVAARRRRQGARRTRRLAVLQTGLPLPDRARRASPRMVPQTVRWQPFPGFATNSPREGSSCWSCSRRTRRASTRKCFRAGRATQRSW